MNTNLGGPQNFINSCVSACAGTLFKYLTVTRTCPLSGIPYLPAPLTVGIVFG